MKNIVIFGATGDLCRRKLIPALYELHKRNLLPSDFKITREKILNGMIYMFGGHHVR